jgi:DNA-binding transcriptional MerR regulator
VVEPSGLLKIGEFAKLAGTNLRTLRYYEEIELLHPASRSSGGFRYYRPEDVNRLKMIRDLQDLGLHLERIRELMATRRATSGREHWVARVRLALSEQDRLLCDRISLLEAQRQKIAVALHKIQECERCKYSPAHENNYCEPCAMTGQRLPETVSALF